MSFKCPVCGDVKGDTTKPVIEQLCRDCGRAFVTKMRQEGRIKA